MAFAFENWILKLASSFRKHSVISAPSQCCEYHKQFAYKAPNLGAVITLGFGIFMGGSVWWA